MSGKSINLEDKKIDKSNLFYGTLFSMRYNIVCNIKNDFIKTSNFLSHI